MAFQTGPGPGREIAILAGPEAEDLFHHLEGLPDRPAGGEGAEVQGAVVGKTPHKPQGREGLLEIKAEAEKIFVVPEPHVKARSVLFDEITFQDQRFPGLGGEDKIHLGCLFQHQGCLGVVFLRLFEVGGQAVPEVRGFAHVKHPAAGILEQINPGGPGRLR